MQFWSFGKINNIFFHAYVFWQNKFWQFQQVAPVVRDRLVLPELKKGEVALVVQQLMVSYI